LKSAAIVYFQISQDSVEQVDNLINYVYKIYSGILKYCKSVYVCRRYDHWSKVKCINCC